ncbi:A/G-specific adenine glycosylase [Winogradskyella sp. 3972H.M.0a.05]|uniref:A/G-specific adenine glycosylase n=1 Tax=Winogradskyella sp. 3972H.M.0a.05 TaxID=2950277 RepID=UPI003394E9B4
MNFSEILSDWYSTNKRELPWRKTKNPYYIWLSEIILQQTQIKQGLPYYEAFVNKYPTVHLLAAAKESEVLKLWQGLGYYSRARNLHYTAKYISEELNGVFPDNYKDLKALKGVGDYTASAIASICFNLPNAVVDGNVYRILSRYFGIETPINSSEGIKSFKALATELIDHENPGDHNQAIMEFGARQCKPRNPNCEICPLNSSCLALKNKQIEMLPVKLKKTRITKKHFNFLVFISSDGKTYFEERTSKGIWQNLYQFPLIESEEEVKDLALHAVFKANYDLQLKSVSVYNNNPIVHKLSHQHLYTKFWIIETDNLGDAAVPISKLKTFPTSILISNFLDSFNFN